MKWKTVPLGKVAKIDRKGVDASDIASGTQFIGLEHIQSGGDIIGSQYVENGDISSTKFRFSQVHVLYGKLRPYLAKVALPDFEGVCSTDILPIAPSPNLDRRYLAYYLRQPSMVDFANSRSTGANLPRLSPKVLETFQIPLPPIEEQRRIAAILDKADGVRRKRKEAIRLTEELLRSAFLEMFGDPVTNPKGWEKKALGSLCTIVRGGSPRPISDYLGGTIPWIKIGDATEGDEIYIHKTAEAIKPEGVKKSRYLEPGSLVFANCGVSLGFARILKIGGCIHDGWLALSDLDESLNQVFLLKSLNSITEHFRAIAPGGTQPNLNTKIMKEFEIPVPPVALQKEFLLVSHHLTASLQKYSVMCNDSENLFNSLLQRAFRGEL